MHPNEQALRDFYAAFDRRDGEAMAGLYAPDATFDDPAFPGLRDGEPADMWRMLTSRSTDLRVELVECTADDRTGRARWVATYTFGQTGRRVVNHVRSTFAFRDGRVVSQRDDFGFWRWSRQSLGLPGLLLGWTPLLRGKVQGTARSGLDAFRAAR
jgi:ketosteroid isomerase-like protein